MSKVEKAFSDLIEYNIDLAINGKSNAFLYTALGYLEATKGTSNDLYTYYRNDGESLVRDLLDTGKGVDESKINCLSDDVLVLYALLERDVLMGVDVSTPENNACLYTFSEEVIKDLISKGQILNADDKWLKYKRGKTPYSLLVDGTLPCFKLEFKGMQGMKHIYKLVTPRVKPTASKDSSILLVPLMAVRLLCMKLTNLFNNNYVKFRKVSAYGDKEHICTTNIGLVKDVYDGFDSDLVLSKLNKIKGGFDMATLRYYAMDVESSLHTVGNTSFKLQSLDAIEIVPFEKIDRSLLNINPVHLREVYRRGINKINGKNIGLVTFTDLSSYGTLEFKREALLKYGESLSNQELYALMTTHTGIFGDVQTALDNKARMELKLIKGLRKVVLPTDLEERKKLLESVANKGLGKVVFKKKDNTISETLFSNNRDVLCKLLGNDYVVEFESPKIRLKELKAIVELRKHEGAEVLRGLVFKYKALDYLLETGEFDGVVKESDIDNALEILEEKKAKKTPNPNLVTLRNVRCDSATKFYKSVSVDSIIELWFSESV